MTYARPDMPMVLVTWIDSNSLSGWHNLTTVEQETGNEMECRSVGFLFRDNAECITVVQSVSETGTFAAIQTIPRAAITSIAMLEERV